MTTTKLAPPELRGLFDMSLQAETIVPTMPATTGSRMVVRVTGGHFEGERLRGRVLGGEDWIVKREDGAVLLNVRLSLELEDGDKVLMRYSGLRHGPADVMATLDQGGVVDPNDYYFRVTASFETPSSHYSWLNRTIGLGTGARFPDRVEYAMFEVL